MNARWALALTLVFVTAPLVGCLGVQDAEVAPQDAAEADTNATNVTLPDEITALEPVASLDFEGDGTGIWIDENRSLLFSANHGGGLHVVDVEDPENPKLLSTLDGVYARDVDLLSWDGRELALLAGAGEGLHVVDVTDPLAPELLATAADHSVHNVASVPGTPYVYDSTGSPVTDREVYVLDVTDPLNPVWHTFPIPATVNGQPVQSNGCHDIVVRVDLGRAYCAGGGNFYVAGGGETFIWDIGEDPLNPEWIGVIDNPSIMYHHQALASEDGTLLFINDEFIAPNCNAVGPAKQSTAAMWVYDVSDEANPELLGYVQPNVESVPANCGSHFGDLVDGTDVLVWGWYGGGVLLIDVSDPANPAILDRKAPASGETWDARYAGGHVYGSAGGLEVFRLA